MWMCVCVLACAQVKSLGYSHQHVTRPSFRQAEKVAKASVVEDDVRVVRRRKAPSKPAGAKSGPGPGSDAVAANSDVTASLGTAVHSCVAACVHVLLHVRMCTETSQQYGSSTRTLVLAYTLSHSACCNCMHLQE